MKLLTNLLDGIRIIKMYTWELAYNSIVGRLRSQEISHLKEIALLRSAHFTLFLCGHGVIMLLTFGAVIWSGGELRLGDAFVVFSLTVTLQFVVTGIAATGL